MKQLLRFHGNDLIQKNKDNQKLIRDIDEYIEIFDEQKKEKV